MGINLTKNIHYKDGGQIVFVPPDCEYLNGKSLDICECKIHMSNDIVERQINKTIYGVMLTNGELLVCNDSVKISNAIIYCSGDLEKYAKSLAAYCRLICGKEKFEITNKL